MLNHIESETRSELSDPIKWILAEWEIEWKPWEIVANLDLPAEQKKDIAYSITDIKNVMEEKGYNLDKIVWSVIDVIENAYKLSSKDTPYDDYETRLKAINTLTRLLQLGKPQSVYNVLNMRSKPPQIN